MTPERSITVDSAKFFAGEITQRDVMPLVTGQESPLAEGREHPVELWGRSIDEYDWVQWACDLVGFERKDIGAVRVDVDVGAATIILSVLLMDEWLPEYTVGLEELLSGDAPEPELRS